MSVIKGHVGGMLMEVKLDSEETSFEFEDGGLLPTWW
jgi:hypothetical protein